MWNEPGASELTRSFGFLGLTGKDEAMNHQLSSWQTQSGQTLWLSSLIAAMERVSRPEWRAAAVDPLELVAVRAHLARPAMVHSAGGSRFSLRN